MQLVNGQAEIRTHRVQLFWPPSHHVSPCILHPMFFSFCQVSHPYLLKTNSLHNHGLSELRYPLSGLLLVWPWTSYRWLVFWPLTTLSPYFLIWIKEIKQHPSHSVVVRTYWVNRSIINVSCRNYYYYYYYYLKILHKRFQANHSCLLFSPICWDF